MLPWLPDPKALKICVTHISEVGELTRMPGRSQAPIHCGD